MYASTRAQDSNGQDSERGFAPRYGQNPAGGAKDVNQSMEFQKMGSGFLSQSMAMGKGKGLSSLGGNKDTSELVVTEDTMNTSVQMNKNLLSTPSSKNDDAELVKKGSDSEDERTNYLKDHNTD